MEKQVCFDSQPAIINDNSNELTQNPEMNSEQNEEGNEKSTSHEDLIDSMWEKLVLYYLSRLKGLCDWGNNENSYDNLNKNSNFSDGSFLDVLSEKQLINQITRQTIQDSMNENNIRIPRDVRTYMAAGYEEGKQQAAKIVIRALKYGVLTGILKKQGSTYRINQKFFKKRCKTPKTSPCKILYRRNYNCKTAKKQYGKHNMKLRTRRMKTRHLKTRKIPGDYTDDENDPPKRRKSSLDSQASFLQSRSKSSSLNKSSSVSVRNKPKPIKPYARKKNSKVFIRKPIKRRPQRRKRDRSQTKSPTPTRSISNKSIQNKPRKLSSFKRYDTPIPKRDGSIISDLSANSICSLCKIKRKRSRSKSSEKSNVHNKRSKK